MLSSYPRQLSSYALPALPDRVACFFSEENPNLRLRIAAHVWHEIWSQSALPSISKGSLFQLDWGQIFLLCSATLKETEFEDHLVARSIGDGDFTSKANPVKQYILLPNPLAFECVLRNEPDRLKKLSEEDLRVEVAGRISVLHYAAALGAVECLSVLLKRLGAKIDSDLLHCCDARFPFGYRQRVLDLLLEQGNLTLAGHKAGVKSLIESALCYGADWLILVVLSNFKDAVDLNDCLCIASEKGHAECVRLLLEHGADVNFQNVSDEKTALLIAAGNGHADCVLVLLMHGADVTIKDRAGWTALMRASERGDADCARLLLEHGADVNAANWNGWTSLMITSQDGAIKCVRLLLEHGADVNAQNGSAWTAFMHACENFHTDCARLLLEHGATVTLKHFHSAFRVGDPARIRLLLDFGADVNATNENGSTALMRASFYGQADCVRLLLEHGADVNARDAIGETALIWASSNGQTDCARLLLEHGADGNARNALGETALTFASRQGNDACVALLSALEC